jgi:transcriptional regulator GlxA family with amidase domain
MARPIRGASVPPSASSSNLVMVQRMVDLLERSYGERLTRHTLSAAVRAKPAALDRVFQGLVGISVHEYLTRVRIEHAAHLIRSGIKVEAVALTVGYRSKKNFYRQFLRHFGVTPETYRRRHTLANETGTQRATIFLEHRFGNRTGTPKRDPDEKRPMPVVRPRR